MNPRYQPRSPNGKVLYLKVAEYFRVFLKALDTIANYSE